MEDEPEKSANGMYNGAVNNVSEPHGHEADDVSGDISVKLYIPAPNIIENGMCKSCDTTIDISTHAIECWECNHMFHATGCTNDEYTVSAPSVFTNQLLPAITNKGVYANRFGTFLWLCDFCTTETEKKRGSTLNDRVSILDKKIENMNSNLRDELKQMKNLLESSLTNTSASVLSNVQPGMVDKTGHDSGANLWNDENRVEKLKQKMLIKPANGTPVDNTLLEKTCVENGVAVLTSYQVKHSQDTAIVLKSQKDAEILKKCLPDHVFEKVAARTPTIVVSGLCREYGKSELITFIKSQNEGIKSLFEGKEVPEEDKKMDVVAMNPLKNHPLVYKATLRVSNVVRSIIANQGDRLYIGNQTVCKVWDSFYISRCYKCQQFGHRSMQCPNEAVCGHCAGKHETRDCKDRDSHSVSVVNCVNCKTAGMKGYDNHPATWYKCPVLKDQQDKLRRTIPFYQGR
jgi:hypothetical protein